MKKNLLGLVVLLVFGLTAAAQTEKASWMVGGNLELNTPKNNTSIIFSPSAGYFFFHNFAAGAILNFNYKKQLDNKTTSFGIGPFARYYFGTMNIRPFLDAEALYEYTRYKPVTSTVNGSNFFLGAGLAAFINRNVAIEGVAGYNKQTIENGGGFSLRVGFQVYLSREQVEKIREKRF